MGNWIWNVIPFSGIIYFSNKIISIIGLAIICLHNLFDVFVFEGQSLDAIVWYFLHQQAIIEISDQTSLIFGYPIIPWIGLMAIGYILGSLYTDYQAKKRTALLMKYGLYSIGAFLILRLTNFYGEPNPFSLQESVTYSIMSFFNTTKIPSLITLYINDYWPIIITIISHRKIQK